MMPFQRQWAAELLHRGLQQSCGLLQQPGRLQDIFLGLPGPQGPLPELGCMLIVVLDSMGEKRPKFLKVLHPFPLR